MICAVRVVRFWYEICACSSRSRNERDSTRVPSRARPDLVVRADSAYRSSERRAMGMSRSTSARNSSERMEMSGMLPPHRRKEIDHAFGSNRLGDELANWPYPDAPRVLPETGAPSSRWPVLSGRCQPHHEPPVPARVLLVSVSSPFLLIFSDDRARW